MRLDQFSNTHFLSFLVLAQRFSFKNMVAASSSLRPAAGAMSS
jgi:hypothetical protein